MTERELRDALAGLYAYDTGSRSSGIHDEALRERVTAVLTEGAEPAELVARLPLSRIVRDLFLTEEALDQGHGIEDVAGFIRWLGDEMGIHLL